MRRVDVDDLVDAAEVAQLLGLSQRNTVHLYLRRYPDMPRPVIDRRGIRLWLRSEIVQWDKKRRRK